MDAGCWAALHAPSVWRALGASPADAIPRLKPALPPAFLPTLRRPAVKQDRVWTAYKQAEVGGVGGVRGAGPQHSTQGNRAGGRLLPACMRCHPLQAPVHATPTRSHTRMQTVFWTAEDIDFSRDPRDWQERLAPGERSFLSSALGYLALSGAAAGGVGSASEAGAALAGANRAPCMPVSAAPSPRPPRPALRGPTAGRLLQQGCGCRFLQEVELPEARAFYSFQVLHSGVASLHLRQLHGCWWLRLRRAPLQLVSRPAPPRAAVQAECGSGGGGHRCGGPVWRAPGAGGCRHGRR